MCPWQALRALRVVHPAFIDLMRPWCGYPQGLNENNTAFAFLPTRCWANPTPGNLLSESNVLGCSSSDTCIVGSATAVGAGAYDVCEACADVDVNHFQRFGCDMALRKCKCGVPIISRTSCMRNSDCWGNTPCALVASLGAQPMGAVDCQSACSRTPVCYIEDNEGAGECVCPLAPPLTRECASTTALLALSVDSGSCMYARDRTLASTLTAYSEVTLEMAALTVTPCILLARSGDGKYMCMSVRAQVRTVPFLLFAVACAPDARTRTNMQTGAISRVVVGTRLLALGGQAEFRRRLLWVDTGSVAVDLASAWHSLVPVMLDSVDVIWYACMHACVYVLLVAERERATRSAVF